MPYASTRDLKEDVLFRAGEELTGSNWDGKVIDYLNRVQRSLCSGASEFLPEYVEDWWWLRESGVLTLIPAVTTGTVALTQGSAAITFSSPPALSSQGYRLRVAGHPEIFSILTHAGGVGAATLDSVYTGPTLPLAAFTLMKVEYDLDAAVASITGPMIGFRYNPSIEGLSPERMDVMWPLGELTTGIPQAFALEDNDRVRFSHGGRTDGFSMRVEYRYRPKVTELIDSTGDFSIVPLEWRHILSDMALTHVMLDKNDDRSNAIALAARTALAGMLKENRRRIPKMSGNAGAIFPRQHNMGWGSQRGPLRTESGLIIG